MAEHVTRLKTLYYVVILVLAGAIVALCLAWASGNAGPGAPATKGSMSVHFIDVGQGDSILVKAGDKAMLVDGGRQSAGPKLASYLKGQGITSIDVIVSTHPHADHIGGLLTILKEFPVKRVVDSGIVHPSQTYESYLRLIDQLNIPYTVAEAGQTIDLGPDVMVKVLAPPSPYIKGGVNENSIVLRVARGNVTFLLMGDAGIPEERYLMASGYGLRSDVYKVPHHGSRHSDSASFISLVRPEISVIEVGPNKYGHPAPRTLSMLRDAGSAVYRTDRNGNIVVTTDGNSFSVTPQHDTPSSGRLLCAPANSVMRCTA
jgi:competence protein ComEC